MLSRYLPQKARGASVSRGAPLFSGRKPNSVPLRLLKARRRRSFIFRRNRFRRTAPFQGRACDRYPRRAPDLRPKPGRRPGVSVWPCTAWGLSCPGGHPPGGGLLPRLFTLTATPERARHGGLFSVTLSIDRDFRPDPLRLFRSMLPCGVRTFLSRRSESDHPPTPKLSDWVVTPKLKRWWRLISLMGPIGGG